ncbi:uncharacterized [Tachysurus ichikawai]
MLCKEEEIPLSQYTMVTICLDNLQHIQHHDLQSQPFPRYGSRITDFHQAHPDCPAQEHQEVFLEGVLS